MCRRLLAWGDPSLYDSTLRILDEVVGHVELAYDVIPGITAVQALTARHRIPLNDIGEPVLITTGRQLARANPLRGSAVVMLDGECSFVGCPPQTRIWWGASPRHARRDSAQRHGGRGGRTHRRGAREARARHGWIMDIYLLREPA